MGSVRRVGLALIAAILLALVPTDLPAAACSPRTLGELGPAPNRVPPPPPPPVLPPSDETGEASDPDAPDVSTPPPLVAPPVTSPPPPRCSYVYRMDFPVVGSWNYLSVFGAIRDGGDRWHAGVDIEAPKLTPVAAVRSGTVTQLNRNGLGDCCWVAIRHSDGWTSLYIHLNNDLSGTDDGTGIGIPPGLEIGDEVAAGQVIGWVGDSGNAEPTAPHIHFELRTPWGEPIDPLPSLRRAASRAAPGLMDLDVGGTPLTGPFVDDDDLHEAALIAFAVTLGLPLACDDYGLRFCPDAPADEVTALRWMEALMFDRLAPPPPPPAEDESEVVTGAESGESPPPFDAHGQMPPAPKARAADTAPAIAEHERLLRLCGEGCATVLTQGDVVRLVEDRVAELLAGGAPATVIVPAMSGEGCSLPGEDPESGLSRMALLRLLMRAFGHAETPPCERIS